MGIFYHTDLSTDKSADDCDLTMLMHFVHECIQLIPLIFSIVKN
jgi:hypothetical protein